MNAIHTITLIRDIGLITSSNHLTYNSARTAFGMPHIYAPTNR